MADSTQSHKLRFGGIEAARGVAAVMVAAYHGARLLAQPRYFGAVPAGGFFNDFNAGVDFFFVLSGFLITWVHWPDLGQPRELGNYAIKRFTRIYPAYWVVLVPMILARLGHLGSTGGTGPRWSNIACSFLLLPDSTPPILGVAWTLVLEMFFYSLFAAAILVGRRIGLLAFLWAALIVTYSLWSVPPSFPANFVLSSYNLEFLLGVSVAILMRRARLPIGWGTAICSALAFFFLVVTHINGWSRANQLIPRLTFGLCASIFLIGSVEGERRKDVALPRGLQLLGAASYSVYLLHSIIEPIVMRGIWPLIKRFPPTTDTVLLTMIGTSGGILFHLAVEKRLMRKIRQWTTHQALPNACK